MVLNKQQKKQKWLRLEEQGWQIVIPNFDIEPHGFPDRSIKGKQKVELAFLNCPCKPDIDFLNKVIAHHSFIEIKAIDDSLNKIFN